MLEMKMRWLWIIPVLFAVTTVSLAQTPDEHAKHHPEQAGKKEGEGEKKGMGGMMEGGMGKMMDGMMEKMGAPKPKDLYPSLMSLPDLPPEQRDEVKKLAHQRMKDGAAFMTKALDALSESAPSDDFAAMQGATAQLREGLTQFETGLAAHRALAEGKAPRNVALQWFKREMNLLPATQAANASGILGMSWSHFLVMLLLTAFFVVMIWMYFFKMRRASQLLDGLATANAAPVPAPATPPETAASKTVPAPAAPLAAAAVAGKWKGQLKVSRIFEETPNVKTFRLVDSDGGPLPFGYLPGQFVTVSVKPGDKTVKRSYTIASAPSQRHYCEITVKREDEGLVSRYLHDKISEGSALDVAAPAGKFVFTGEESDSIVLVGGGVGITPMMSVIRYLTDTAWKGSIHLLYCCRTTNDFIYREELEHLQRRHANLHVVATMTRADGTVWMGLKGRFTTELIQESVPDITGKRIHICGPPAMMEAITDMLDELGVPKDNIKTEAFGPAKKPKAKPAAESKPESSSAAGMVTFKQSGKSAPLPEGETILDVADELGIEIENSCRTGSCGSCIVKLLSGDVTMECDDGLEPEDREQGYVLACQAVSNGSVEVDA